MDSTRETLERLYPRCRWTRLGTHWSGRCGPVLIAVYPTNAGWKADGQAGARVDHAAGADMQAALAGLRPINAVYVNALHPTPYEKPQRWHFPAMMLPGLGRGLLPSRWTVLVVAMAMGLGALFAVWLTGGGA